MKNVILACALILVAVIISCNGTVNKEKDSESTAECNKPTIKDPNGVKPMALMMRTMAMYCDSMRLKINEGFAVDSLEYPLPHFWTAEPTDSTVLETLFFNNAAQFQKSYAHLMSDKANQKENYTILINSCINCHSSYCSGPIKRIKKLMLDYRE